MRRIDEIRFKVTQAATMESQPGGNMRIPGMKIGSEMGVQGPGAEDILWMTERLEMAAKFMKEASYSNENDMMYATKLVRDIEEGR